MALVVPVGPKKTDLQGKGGVDEPQVEYSKFSVSWGFSGALYLPKSLFPGVHLNLLLP